MFENCDALRALRPDLESMSFSWTKNSAISRLFRTKLLIHFIKFESMFLNRVISSVLYVDNIQKEHFSL